MTRRQLLVVVATSVVGAPVAVRLASPERAGDDATFPFRMTDAEWQTELTAAQYRVLRRHATERAFSSPLDREHRPGRFLCAGCKQPLFDASTKFDSGTGWPSFWRPLDAAVGTRVDVSWMMVRTEVHCANCGGHLGHVFSDGPPPTGLRYCMNGVAMQFEATT